MEQTWSRLCSSMLSHPSPAMPWIWTWSWYSCILQGILSEFDWAAWHFVSQLNLSCTMRSLYKHQ